MNDFLNKLLHEIEKMYFSGTGCMDAINAVKKKYRVR
jgi:hypothetical protein